MREALAAGRPPPVFPLLNRLSSPQTTKTPTPRYLASPHPLSEAVDESTLLIVRPGQDRWFTKARARLPPHASRAVSLAH